VTPFETLVLFFALSAFLWSTYAVIEVKAMQRSTHKIQLVNPWAKDLQELEEEFEEITPAKRKELKNALKMGPPEQDDDEEEES
jgi:hypothetical protein